MNQIDTGCLICGYPLEYYMEDTELSCHVCGRLLSANARCTEGHFVCDACHGADAYEYILRHCSGSDETDPVMLADFLMKNPKVKTHGTEHHFLVPAVLLTVYYNLKGKEDLKEEKLLAALKRSKSVKDGSCGFSGNCGAAVGTGIFMSIILGATTLSREEWKLSNLITAESLKGYRTKRRPPLL